MQNPAWLNRTAYPFRSRVMELADGQIHYVDEGQGPTLLMIHGTPTWSFLYRKLITALAPSYRCIALDHLGFGLSVKPPGGQYRPEDHARRLREFIERLGLRDIVLVVHDFGGPIGLSYAIDQPENVRALVLCNTWMWSLRGKPSVERLGRIMGGPVGRLLSTRLNFSPRVLLRAAWGDKASLTPEIHDHYTKVFPTPADRQAPWVLARELLGSSTWFAQLWEQRKRIADKPALLLWGMRDPTFTPADLARWQALFPDAGVVRLEKAGHFVPEEAPEITTTVRDFLAQTVDQPLATPMVSGPDKSQTDIDPPGLVS